MFGMCRVDAFEIRVRLDRGALKVDPETAEALGRGWGRVWC